MSCNWKMYHHTWTCRSSHFEFWRPTGNRNTEEGHWITMGYDAWQNMGYDVWQCVFVLPMNAYETVSCWRKHRHWHFNISHIFCKADWNFFLDPRTLFGEDGSVITKSIPSRKLLPSILKLKKYICVWHKINTYLIDFEPSLFALRDY